MSGRPRIPLIPSLLPSDWRPDERLLEHADIRLMAEDGELDQAIIEFRTFCVKHGLRRARWGHTFRTWLQHRHEPDFEIVRGGDPQ